MTHIDRERPRSTAYLLCLGACVIALAFAFLNGLYRGHWFSFGIVADCILFVSVVALYLKQKRKLDALNRGADLS